ncbi:8373_t:CDS:2, partial [Dentiscutata erythropus]
NEKLSSKKKAICWTNSEVPILAHINNIQNTICCQVPRNLDNPEILALNTKAWKKKDLNQKTTNKTIEEKKSEPKFILKKNKSDKLDYDSAIKQVKDILSTSPQILSSPRMKSAPESYKT